MSQAEDLLNSLSEEDAATVIEELVMPVNEVLMINPETRTINVPDSEKLFGARQDMGVERKHFKCPRIVGDNIDLSEHRIFVNYVPSKQDGSYDPKEEVQGYWCKDLVVEGDFVTFSWELSGNAMRSAGYIAFAVYAKTIDEYGNLQTKWHTTIAIGNVLDTLPDGEEWVTVYPDIVMQLLERMDEVEKIATPESMQGYVDDYFNRNPLLLDRELKDETKAAPADIVGKLSKDIATKASAIKETASGETIVVTDSDEQKPLGLAIDGKSEQNQYSGNQLLDFSEFTTKTIDGVTVSHNGDGVLSVKGTSTASNGIFLNGKSYSGTDVVFSLKAGTYYVSGLQSGLMIFLYKSNVETSSAVRLNTDGVITLTEDTDFVSVSLRWSGIGVVFDISDLKIMLNSGNSALPWEPYCGGIPSPNPSYPQEIRNIGVYDEASGKYKVEVKGTGKNFLDYEEWKTKLANSSLGEAVRGTTVFENNGVTITATDNNAYTRFEGTSSYSYKIPVNVEDSIILSWEENSGKDGMVWIFANGDSTMGVNVNTKNVKELAYTVPKDVTFITVRFGVANSGDTISYKNIMLRLSEITDNTYEPYKETTATVLLDEPLRKGDKVYWNGGSKVRVDRYRAVEVFDGSDDEKWKLEECSVGYRYRIVFSNGILSDTTNGVTSLNSMVTPAASGGTWTNLNRYTIGESSSGKSLLYVTTNGTDNLEEFKTRLAENPMILEYTCTTPITEEIDIDLGELTMFYPTTILSNDCNANMEVTYIADTKAYIDKKFAELATAMV